MMYRFLASIIGAKPLSRSMRSFWVKSQNPLSMKKRSLRYGRFNLRLTSSRHMNRIPALQASRSDARERLVRRGEEYRMRRRPFAFFAVNRSLGH